MTHHYDNPFRARPERYSQNMEGALRTFSRPGIIQKPDGTVAPAVIVFRDRHVLSVLTIEDAIRLSNELIDATERQIC
ncbi:hypothetical protein [Arthrobacter sp. D5-1]|uniref:hypothetical protein n=1 Tax=Arthrobacter sp. D5-1 TaxID=1477518 RepID=UPI001A997C39|nr:hypothetical protein [Arthrobacter sp. D5-1]QSZ49582.1 hypothetical protein AYX22_15015 [Arthrobacter sp. D5-1]